MKKFLLSTVAVAMLSTAANAADLDMAPEPEPMPAYDWTGFYVGVAAGWLGGKSKSRLEYFLDGEFYEDALFSSWGRKYSPDGGMFGGYAGYNWQMDSGLVLGIEGDFYGANAKDRKSVFYRNALDDELELYGKDKIKSTWAVRGRLGWAIDNFMPYIAGGFAGASMKSTVGANYIDCCNPDVDDSDGASKTKSYSGWTFGAGAEWMVTPSWVLRLDYQYKDLGKKTNLRASRFFDTDLFSVRNRTKLTTNQFTFGAAFKF